MVNWSEYVSMCIGCRSTAESRTSLPLDKYLVVANMQWLSHFKIIHIQQPLGCSLIPDSEVLPKMMKIIAMFRNWSKCFHVHEVNNCVTLHCLQRLPQNWNSLKEVLLSRKGVKLLKYCVFNPQIALSFPPPSPPLPKYWQIYRVKITMCKNKACYLLNSELRLSIECEQTEAEYLDFLEWSKNHPDLETRWALWLKLLFSRHKEISHSYRQDTILIPLSKQPLQQTKL